MKILLLAFGNPDNVLSLSRHLSSCVELTVVFAVSGDRFRQGVMDADISGLDSGLITDEKTIEGILSPEIRNYSSGRFKLWFLKTPSRKFLHKSGGIKNYLIIRKAARELSSYGFDAVHFNGTSGFLLYLLKHLKCGKRVWTLHDYKPHSGEENTFGVLLNKIYTKFNIIYIQHYKYLKEEFARYFSIKSELVKQVYSGAFDVYGQFKQKEIDVPENYILFFGRFSKYKGLDFLIRAFKMVKDDRLCLVAAGAGRTDCEASADGRIKIINRYIEPSELAALVKHSMCVVTPYIDSTHSGVIMTAYAFNKPVISSDVGGIKEVLADGVTGLLFDSGDEYMLAEKIDLIAADAKLREIMSSNIEKMKSDGILNWDKITKDMSEIYMSL